MPTINSRACVVNGTPIDKVFSDGKLVYGRNIVIDTSNELKTIIASNWGGSPSNSASGTYGAGKYYASAYVENTTPVNMNIFIHLNGMIGNISGDGILAGQSGIVSCTFDILDGQSLNTIWVGFSNQQTERFTYKYKEIMIKHTPSAWTPAPEDVM